MHDQLASALTLPAPTAQGVSPEEWARSEGLTTSKGELDYAAIGERINKDRTTVYRTLTGRLAASNSFVEAIILASKGAIDANWFYKRAYSKAAATREVSPSGPFSSRSTSRPRAGSGAASRLSRPSSPTSSPAPAPSRPSSEKRSRP